MLLNKKPQAKDKDMDPQACLNEMLRAIERDDMVEARRALADLMKWHAEGGFMPDLGLALLTLADAAD
jgi:hypothetical protein